MTTTYSVLGLPWNVKGPDETMVLDKDGCEVCQVLGDYDNAWERMVAIADFIVAASRPDGWQQYAKAGESAQDVIERTRADNFALLKLLVDARAALAPPQLEAVAQQPDAHVDLSPEAKAEQFIQAAVDRAPEPLRRLGEFLQNVLDEDRWAMAERMLLGIAVATPEALPTQEAGSHKTNPAPLPIPLQGADEELMRQALAWWRGHRPISWSESEHLANPGINCTGSAQEKALAEAIGAVLGARLKGKDGQG